MAAGYENALPLCILSQIFGCSTDLYGLGVTGRLFPSWRVQAVKPSEVADRIETFVRRQFDVMPNDPRFSRTIDLFELGYLDSVGFVELLAFLEEEFGVEIPENEL